MNEDCVWGIGSDRAILISSIYGSEITLILKNTVWMRDIVVRAEGVGEVAKG